MQAAAATSERPRRKREKAAPSRVIIEVEPVTSPGPLAQSFGRIGGNLGPNEVTSILIEADNGTPARLVDLTHESRQKDGTLQSLLQTYELAIQALDWDCVAPAGARGGEPKKKDKKIAAAFKAALRAARNFPRLVAHHTGEALLFGHATSETIWEMRAGYIAPVNFINVSCRRFAFTQEESRLVYLESPNAREGVDLLEAYPLGKFIQSRRRVNGDVPVREGLCRSIVWSALFRNWTIRDWLQLAEMSWKPWRKGKFKKSAATTDDVRKLRRILEGMTSSGIAIYPDSYEIDVAWPQFSGSQKMSNHRELAEFMARELSKAILGTTDIVEPGENGSRAAVETRDGLRVTLRDAVALALAADIKQFILEPFVRMNFGETATVPEFFFLTEDPADLEKFASAIQKLRAAGLRIPASYVYEQTGMPAPKQGEETLGATAGEDPNEPPGADPNGNEKETQKEAA